jgi:hypothetical protein
MGSRHCISHWFVEYLKIGEVNRRDKGVIFQAVRIK